MNRTLLFLIALFAVSGVSAQAAPLSPAEQEALQTAEADLLRLSYTMHTDSSDEARFVACKTLIRDLVGALKTPNSFNYDFSGLEGVKVITSPDSTFRFFSWELHVNRDEYRHYGAIQFNERDLKLVPLIDRGNQLRQNPETAITSNENWLGYVVYKLMPAGVFEGKKYYFLFGYDRYAATSRQKLLDVFYFDASGTPTFGLPVFVTYTPEGHLLEDRTRLLLQYNAEASVALRYEEETGRIVYENLIIARGQDGSPTNMPDGSYHALELGKDGRWHEISKIFSHKYEAAPIPVPNSSTKADLLGRTSEGG